MPWPRAALLAALLFLAKQLLVSGLTPALHAPDEQAHFDYVQRIAESGQLPRCETAGLLASAGSWSPEVRALLAGTVTPIAFHPERPLPTLPAGAIGGGPEARLTDGCNYVTLYPPLYYQIAALGYRTAAAGTVWQRLFAARLSGSLWGLLAVLSAFAAGVLFGGRSGDGLLLALLVILQPMASFLFGAVNSDGAVIACGSAAAAAVAWLWRRPLSAAPLASLGACALAGALSKPTFVLLLPWLALVALLVLGWRRPSSWLRLALALAPAAAVTLGWTWWMRGVYLSRAGASESGPTLAGYLLELVSNPSRLYLVWVKLYWVGWGWVDVFLRPPAYLFLCGGLLASAIGAGFKLRGGSGPERFALLWGATATAGLLATLHLLEWRLLRRGELAFVAGRYLLGLLVPHALMIVLGLRGLGERLSLGRDLAWAAVPALVLLDAAAELRCVARYTPAGSSRLAHAREVYQAFAPGWFEPALALHLLALLAALLLAARALARAPAQER